MVKAKTKKKPKKKRRIKLDPAERKKRRIARKFKSDIRTSFVNGGFEHISTREHNINVVGRTGDIDALFVYENIIVVIEDTTSKQDHIHDHLIVKAEFFRHLNKNLGSLISTLKREFPKFRGFITRNSKYEEEEYKIKFVYCSMNNVDNKYKRRYSDICYFLDYPFLKYFLNLSRTIHKSSCYEIYKFLELDLEDIGLYSSSSTIRKYDGLLLPETSSSFPSGHKIVSFLVDPNMLLEQGYVLRSDSWRDPDCLYQRLLIKRKILSMREYLVKEKRVFVNNIIATLPTDAIIRDKDGKKIGAGKSILIKPITIEIAKRFNSIGIIDGQHRLYSYHKGIDNFDRAISVLREKQHLLITGIVYPQGITEQMKRRFEAKLFLEINDKQKRVRGDLKQLIEVIVNPNSAIAISKSVIIGLAQNGPLTGQLEVHFYDEGKIKTTSIVSYGLRHIVSLDAIHSFYKIWRGTGKANIKRNKVILSKYIEYCVKEINKLISGFKYNVPNNLWTTDKKISRVLTTTTINGLIFCLRRLIENRKTGDFSYYKNAFKKMDIDFKPDNFDFKSSHWKGLGEKLYKDCF